MMVTIKVGFELTHGKGRSAMTGARAANMSCMCCRMLSFRVYHNGLAHPSALCCVGV